MCVTLLKSLSIAIYIDDRPVYIKLRASGNVTHSNFNVSSEFILKTKWVKLQFKRRGQIEFNS